MEISERDGIQLIGDLWANKFPLVRRYFGEYLGQLLRALQEKPFKEHFTNYAFHPQNFERRLESIEPLGLTEAIVREVGKSKTPIDLDRRLVDAWAELRFISQIQQEGFRNISKVAEIADFTAKRNEKSYAFQVTRINTLLKEKVSPSTPVNNEMIPRIHDRLDDPISSFFWNALERKNGKFRNWVENQIRCIVIVSSDKDLQDPMIRHIACQQIRVGIHLLVRRHFEELLWLPDLGGGAWFKVGATLEESRCFADWKDELKDSDGSIMRKEVELSCPIPRWMTDEAA